jgi:hypothetical protein
MAADQDAETHEDESNGHDEPIVGAKWARSRIFWTVAIRPHPVVHLIPRLIASVPAPEHWSCYDSLLSVRAICVSNPCCPNPLPLRVSSLAQQDS